MRWKQSTALRVSVHPERQDTHFAQQQDSKSRSAVHPAREPETKADKPPPARAGTAQGTLNAHPAIKPSPEREDGSLVLISLHQPRCRSPPSVRFL